MKNNTRFANEPLSICVNKKALRDKSLDNEFQKVLSPLVHRHEFGQTCVKRCLLAVNGHAFSQECTNRCPVSLKIMKSLITNSSSQECAKKCP